MLLTSALWSAHSEKLYATMSYFLCSLSDFSSQMSNAFLGGVVDELRAVQFPYNMLFVIKYLTSTIFSTSMDFCN